jgi:hypothetical protein
MTSDADLRSCNRRAFAAPTRGPLRRSRPDPERRMPFLAGHGTPFPHLSNASPVPRTVPKNDRGKASFLTCSGGTSCAALKALGDRPRDRRDGLDRSIGWAESLQRRGNTAQLRNATYASTGTRGNRPASAPRRTSIPMPPSGRTAAASPALAASRRSGPSPSRDPRFGRDYPVPPGGFPHNRKRNLGEHTETAGKTALLFDWYAGCIT